MSPWNSIYFVWNLHLTLFPEQHFPHINTAKCWMYFFSLRNHSDHAKGTAWHSSCFNFSGFRLTCSTPLPLYLAAVAKPLPVPSAGYLHPGWGHFWCPSLNIFQVTHACGHMHTNETHSQWTFKHFLIKIPNLLCAIICYRKKKKCPDRIMCSGKRNTMTKETRKECRIETKNFKKSDARWLAFLQPGTQKQSCKDLSDLWELCLRHRTLWT